MTDAKGATAPGIQRVETREELAARYEREADLLMRMHAETYDDHEFLTSMYFRELAMRRRETAKEMRESGDG